MGGMRRSVAIFALVLGTLSSCASAPARRRPMRKLLAAGPSAPATAPSPPRRATREPFPREGAALERCLASERIARSVSRRHRVPLALLMSIMRVESNFRPDARSRAGALGLMQIMPRTGRGLGCGSLGEPQANIECGARLMARLLGRFERSEVYALGAYNGGAGYVRGARRAKKAPPNMGYVEAVLRAKTRYRRGRCAAVVAPLRRPLKQAAR